MGVLDGTVRLNGQDLQIYDKLIILIDKIIVCKNNVEYYK